MQHTRYAKSSTTENPFAFCARQELRSLPTSNRRIKSLTVSFASCASTSFCDNIVAIAYTSVVFVCCGDYIIPLFEAICYFYVHFQAVFAFKAEISVTFLAVSHVGSFSYNKKHNNKKRFEKRIRRDCFVHTPSTIFSKKLYEAAGCEKNTRQFRLIEDAPTWYSIIKSDCFRSLLYSDSTIVLYRKSGVSVSKNRDPQNPFHLEKKKLYKIYAEDAQGLERLFLKLRNSNLRALNVVFSRFNAILNYAGVLTLVLDIGYYRFAKEMKIRAEKEQQYYMHLKERTSNLYASH